MENVAWIRLAPRWAPQGERQLPVGPRLLGEVVVAAQGLFPALHEVLAHGASGVRRDVLQRSGIGGRRRNDDRVFHRALLFQSGPDPSDRGGALPGPALNAEPALPFLVGDRLRPSGPLPRQSDAYLQLA